jgi:hypothetical protein
VLTIVGAVRPLYQEVWKKATVFKVEILQRLNSRLKSEEIWSKGEENEQIQSALKFSLISRYE